MNIVDSSGWLAYFANEKNAENFLDPLKETDSLVVPTVTIYEVFKVVLREAGDNEALQAAASMQRGIVADLTAQLSIAASKLSLQIGLPFADSVILATAGAYDAVLWTQDSDFIDIPGVRYIPK